jgi:hypothetical protein
MKNTDLCVPASALEQEDGTEAPAVGSEVSVTVMGKVSKIEGGEVYLTPIMANGVPLQDKGGEKAVEADEDGPSREALMKWANDSGMTED